MMYKYERKTRNTFRACVRLFLDKQSSWKLKYQTNFLFTDVHKREYRSVVLSIDNQNDTRLIGFLLGRRSHFFIIFLNCERQIKN